MAVPVANAQPGAYSYQDDTYYRLLTKPNEYFGGFVVSDFALIRAQGLRACAMLDSGAVASDAIHDLQVLGPYSFDAANRIVSAAFVAYCPGDIVTW